jgi:tRNA nucleotidyltransferase (CCA-adding enzyme)
MQDPRALLETEAPWLLAEDLGVCVVGSAALAEACKRDGWTPPPVADLDLAWGVDLEAGQALLERHGVALPTTAASRARGTLACKLAGTRIEITAFRGRTHGTIEERAVDDLQARDMTIGALAWWLAQDRILDPLGGLAHWREGRIVAAGDPEQRIREHPVRWLRYYRRAAQWGFALDRAIRKVALDPAILAQVPPEALAAEMRAALLDCPSPGTFLQELREKRLLEIFAPPLDPLFDGRPAGPVRHHPEISQALHMVLALEWIALRSRELPDERRLAVMLAVLCHDLGKGATDGGALPSHPGHESLGLPMIDALAAHLPGLCDAKALRLCKTVCLLHLRVRTLRAQRPGTLAALYDRHLRGQEDAIDLLALAVGADVGGRLGRAAAGEDVAREVERELRWLQRCCESVDARALRARHDDVGRFRAVLHEARARAIAAEL